MSDEELIALHEQMRKEAFNTVGSELLKQFFEIQKETPGASNNAPRDN